MSTLNWKWESDGVAPPKWAWRVAVMLLPQKVLDAANLWFLASVSTMHPKGIDATLRDLIELKLDGELTYYKAEMSVPGGKISVAEETHNNISHCNAAGCDGTQCDPDNNHMKGDF